MRHTTQLLPLLAVAAFAGGAHAQKTADAARDTAAQKVTQDADAEAGARDEAAVDDGAEARRILKLSSGQSIRVLARQADDGAWEYRGKRGWERLDPRIVVHAERERDVLKAWRQRTSGADRKDPAVRVELARWAAGAGLASEALAELDRVLEDDPDHVGAREVLASSWLLTVPSLDVPAEAEGAARAELVRFGSTLPPAGREVAVRELAQAKDRAALQRELARDLWSPIVVRRSFAALALRRIFPGEEVKPLLVHSVRDASENVRRESARALRGVGDPAVTAPLINALDSSSLAIRANSAAALGEMGYAAAVQPLMARMSAALQSGGEGRAPHAHVFFGRQIAYIQDFDVEVAQFQAVADPQINVLLEGSVLDAAVIGTREESVSIEVVAIRGALEKLTGERPGGTARDWLRWWEVNSERWQAKDHAAPATGN